VLALVENIPGGALNKVAPEEWTQQDLDGLIVRCLILVRRPFQWDLEQQPPKRIPTLDECLAWFAQNGKAKTT
jgi:hypothetical protein